MIVGTVLEADIGPKATTLGRCRDFFIATFYLGGGDMNMATINIRIFKLHTLEPLRPDTYGGGG